MFPTNTILFAPNLDRDLVAIDLEAELAITFNHFESLLRSCLTDSFTESSYSELVATLEGTKGLIPPKPREIHNLGPRSKGVLASRIEAEITSFDRHQKNGAMAVLDGLQRIRGLAGSGKTIVLTMKAALTHLRDADATIVYTFYTKSLYQHIQRLITRFYRQFEERTLIGQG